MWMWINVAFRSVVVEHFAQESRMKGIICRYPSCTYQYMPHKLDSKLSHMFIEIGGGGQF